ncbi:DNA ligase [Candidatus Woesearchaeota archaeon]|nr:DNA ligase [Candidatus Woesearchaeota archaeon]
MGRGWSAGCRPSADIHRLQVLEIPCQGKIHQGVHAGRSALGRSSCGAWDNMKRKDPSGKGMKKASGRIRPMLARLGDKDLLSRKGYIFEPKLDGTRALLYLNKSRMELVNRRQKDITRKYPELELSGDIDAESCVLDGEIIVYDQKGNPSFRLLQKRDQIEKKFLIAIRSDQYPATYVVFDILRKDGKDLTDTGFAGRKKILMETVSNGENMEIIFSTVNGKKLWKEIQKRKLEGVMAKKKDSRYYPGKRAPVWLKIKFLKTMDCIIVGYTHEKRVISALALAAYEEIGDKKKLRYIGRVGTGFTETFLKKLHEKLKNIRIEKPPVRYKGSKDVKWVKPKYICEVRYLEFSKDKIIRAPAFLRMRDDKELKECILEAE